MNQIIRKTNNSLELLVLDGQYFTTHKYLDDLKNQLKNDIYPILATGSFTVSRNCFCFIDHLSSLRYINNKKLNQTSRIIETLNKFASFDNYINDKYKKYAPYVVQIYRHDLVHNVRPLQHRIDIVDKSNKTIGVETWFVLSAIKPKKYPNNNFDKAALFFKSKNNRKGLCHLRYYGNQVVLNNYCLFYDLVNYIDEYKVEWQNDSVLNEQLAKNYKAITEEYLPINNFVLNKDEDTECVIL